MSSSAVTTRRVSMDLLKNPVVISYAVLGLTWLLAVLFVGGFASWSSNQQLIRTASYLGIIAIGQTLVIMMGGIDLSVSGVVALAAVVCAQVRADLNSPAAMLIALLVCALVGAANATGIVLLRLPPIVMTLASGTIISGALLVYTDGQPRSAHISVLDWLANDSLLGIPVVLVAWLLLTAILWWLLHRSRYGRYGEALGSMLPASLASGVPVAATTFVMYIGCAVMAGVSGLILLGFTGTSSLTMGEPYQLLSIAAVVLGGTSILGGRGHVAGSVSGALLLTLIVALLTSWDIGEAQRRVAQGLLLIGLLLFYAREKADR